ncbi:hypothetical protein [Hydrogenophaga sp. OTU3427]|uniref:hypothetical protein n=1 Tax=Hydrogenophaga sp. OTU3427 TaxID=3043856 RepID=UPI00313B8643
MIRWTIVIVLLLALAACQRGQPEAWFPLVDGDEQVYRVEIGGDEPQAAEEWTLRVHGPVPFHEHQTMVRHHSAGVGYHLVSDEQGVRRVAIRTDIDDVPQADPEPLWVLKAPYVVGTEWTQPTVPHLLRRRNEHPRELKHSHRTLMTWRIEAVDEIVSTPAGSFRPCLRVEGRGRLNLYTDPVNGFTDVPLISREWYCRGKGLVKFEREEKVPSGFLTGGLLTAEWVR